jgi:hypothetical protein
MQSAPDRSLPVAALRVDGRRWERETEEITDAALARLVRRRLKLDRMQGWIVLGTIVALCSSGLITGALFHSGILLFGVATLAASLGVCAGFFSERALLAWFMSDGRSVGLSDRACRRLFDKAPGAAKVVEVMRSLGREPSDAELARFVR